MFSTISRNLSFHVFSRLKPCTCISQKSAFHHFDRITSLTFQCLWIIINNRFHGLWVSLFWDMESMQYEDIHMLRKQLTWQQSLDHRRLWVRIHSDITSGEINKQHFRGISTNHKSLYFLLIESIRSNISNTHKHENTRNIGIENTWVIENRGMLGLDLWDELQIGVTLEFPSLSQDIGHATGRSWHPVDTIRSLCEELRTSTVTQKDHHRGKVTIWLTLEYITTRWS